MKVQDFNEKTKEATVTGERIIAAVKNQLKSRQLLTERYRSRLFYFFFIFLFFLFTLYIQQSMLPFTRERI